MRAYILKQNLEKLNVKKDSLIVPEGKVYKEILENIGFTEDKSIIKESVEVKIAFSIRSVYTNKVFVIGNRQKSLAYLKSLKLVNAESKGMYSIMLNIKEVLENTFSSKYKQGMFHSNLSPIGIYTTSSIYNGITLYYQIIIQDKYAKKEYFNVTNSSQSGCFEEISSLNFFTYLREFDKIILSTFKKVEKI